MTERIFPTDRHGHPLGPARDEVVRCRECKRYIPQGTYRFNSGVVNKDTCDVIRGFVVQIEPDGFCAWGARADE